MHADTPPSARKTWLLLAGLVAFAAIVRLIGIGVPSLWGDELYSVSFSRIPMDMLWGDWMVRETNPPLFYSILKGWIALFGEQDTALRVLTIIVGLAAIGGIFLFVRALHSTQAALLAVALQHRSGQGDGRCSAQARGHQPLARQPRSPRRSSGRMGADVQGSLAHPARLFL